MKHFWVIKTILQDNSNMSVYLSKANGNLVEFYNGFGYSVNIDYAMKLKSKTEAQMLLDGIVDKEKFIIEKVYI